MIRDFLHQHCQISREHANIYDIGRRNVGKYSTFGHKTLRVVRQACIRVQATSSRSVGFRPCIDIHKGKVKQIVGSTLSDKTTVDGANALETNFESHHGAEYYANLYKRDNLTGGHIIMLGADEQSKDQAMRALKAFPGGMQLGGGVTTENAKEYLHAGASHVIVTSFVFRDGALDEQRLSDLVKLVGKENIVLDLSCRKRADGMYYVVTDRWQKWSDLALTEDSLTALSASCDEFLVHGVDVEGKKLGIDDELVEMLGKWSPVPVTYAGGATTLDDLDRVASKGNYNVEVTVGSALDIFGGDLKYEDVVSWHHRVNADRQVSSMNGEPQGDGTILYKF